MAFNIDNYVDVPTRLKDALAKHPNLRIQETAAEVVTMPDGSTFYRCTVTVWRDETDPIPAIATAAEPYPGKTPYTKNSEFMVGMTSALGRALGYMGFGISKSIASRNEIEARQDPQKPDAQIAPIRREQATNTHSKGASQKQVYFIKSLAKGAGFDEAALHDYIAATLDSDAVTLETLSPEQATKMIDALKQLPSSKAD
tara:strand:+ start:471 stop:1070 length:600 start_codon:yes stop_codon:yes gene_type:complete